MSCMSAKTTRVGGICVRCTKEQTGITATLSHEAIQARLSMVCTPSIRTPYLEISPEILWVYSDLEQYNDVLSNTYWNIH